MADPKETVEQAAGDYVYDERSGCIAIYRGPIRECLENEHLQDLVLFLLARRTESGWEFKDHQLEMAHKVWRAVQMLEADKAKLRERLEWMCSECREVFPSEALHKGLQCVFCPKCDRSTCRPKDGLLLSEAQAENAKLRAERDHLKRALLRLDRIMAGDAKPGGTEPEDIQAMVEVFVRLKAERNEALAMAKTVYCETDFYADWNMHEAPLVEQEADEDLFALKTDHNSLLTALMSVRDMVNQPLTWTTDKHRQQAGEESDDQAT